MRIILNDRGQKREITDTDQKALILEYLGLDLSYLNDSSLEEIEITLE